MDATTSLEAVPEGRAVIIRLYAPLHESSTEISASEARRLAEQLIQSAQVVEYSK